MDDLRAEVAELGGLGVRQRGERLRVLHHARVGAHDPTHVGVDAELVRGYGGREDGGRIVRPAPAERRGHALGGRADEPGDHRYRAVAEARRELLCGARFRFVEDRVGVAELVVGDDEALGRERLGLHPMVIEHRGDDRRRDPLAVRDDRVHRPGRAFAQDRDALQERVGPFGEVSDLFEHVG